MLREASSVVDIRRLLPPDNVVDVLHRAPNRLAAWRFLRRLTGARRVKYIRNAIDGGADHALEEALDDALGDLGFDHDPEGGCA